ncbi:MAG: short-chain dehydrogenase [Chthoniobacteraceae bacterium]|nr:short-chain dehydrogenase [Chthoniobacteraceae bacterium]
MSTITKIALVTGANKGIGFEIARRLGQQGVTVILAARNKNRGLAAADQLKAENIDVHPLILDVTHIPSIARASEYLESEFGRLDILVNNAGISHDISLKPSETPIETIRDVFETNFFGTIAVTQGLLSLLHKSPAGRIVNLSSGLGSLSEGSNPASPFYNVKPLGYNASKTALNAFTVILAHELRNTPIKVNSADPDWCRTDLGGEAAPHTAADGAETALWLATLEADGPTGGFFNGRLPVAW